MPTTPVAKLDRQVALDALLTYVETKSEVLGIKAPAASSQSSIAELRVALDRIANYSDAAKFTAAGHDLSQIVRTVVGWDGGTTRFSKKLVKILAEGGAESYSQMAEMVSFFALAAPLLEPDRLARIAQMITTTTSAYRPMRYPVVPARELATALTSFPQQRREILLASLWEESHRGRWWEATVVGDTPDPEQPRPRRGAPDAAEHIATVAGLLQLSGEGNLHFSHGAIQDLQRLKAPSVPQLRQLAALSRSSHPDTKVLLAHMRQLPPDSRPESPIPAMISIMVRSRQPVLGRRNLLAERPRTWAELHPVGTDEQFATPAALVQFHRKEIPGLVGSNLFVITTLAGLQANKTHMGNCTLGYRVACATGDTTILRLDYDRSEYNIEVNYGRGVFSLGQVNTRFNRGAGDPLVSEMMRRWLQTLRDPRP